MAAVEEVFVFQAPNVAINYLSAFLDMRGDDELCDVTIWAGRQSMKAHRVVLAAAIPYFRAMFSNKMAESRQSDITMEDVDPLTLEDIINFVYTNELKITNTNVLLLLEVSIYLQFDTVVDACFGFVQQQISPSSVLTISAYAEAANRVTVMKTADKYIRENFEDVATSEDFLDLPLTTLKELVSTDDLLVRSERVVFEAVMRWIKAEVERGVYLQDLLRQIRMFCLTLDYLNTNISGEELIQASPACREMVAQAKMYHKLPETLIQPSGSFTLRGRHWKERMYALCCDRNLDIAINHYDPTGRKWSVLMTSIINARDVKYVVCTERVMYFIDFWEIRTIDLQTYECSSLEHDEDFPVDAAAVLHHHKLYLFGSACYSSREVRSFDLLHGPCVKVGEMTEKREFPGLVPLGDDIYVLGGNSTFSTLRSAERYNAVTGRSSQIPPMFAERSKPSCAALNGKIYACGGETAEEFVSVEVYNPLTNLWNLIKQPSCIKGGMYLTAYASRLYATSKESGENEFLFETYNPSKNKWKTGQPAAHSGEMLRIIAVLVTNSASYIPKIW